MLDSCDDGKRVFFCFFGPKFGKSRSPKLDPDANDNRAENHWGLKSPLSDYRPEFTRD